jgi:hypothetical protein
MKRYIVTLTERPSQAADRGDVLGENRTRTKQFIRHLNDYIGERQLGGKVSFIGAAMNLPFVDIEWTPEVAGAITSMPEVDSVIENFDLSLA